METLIRLKGTFTLVCPTIRSVNKASKLTGADLTDNLIIGTNAIVSTGSPLVPSRSHCALMSKEVLAKNRQSFLFPTTTQLKSHLKVNCARTIKASIPPDSCHFS